ncbi:recombinase family protein [Castellaniella sp.]|uniref:recombinase family protein n=1 Tax=Castellaniella sp. TaxID=1955812 RepID=UPI002AFF0763|nr:recombinase family protein [Castellaniella sp.]
MFSETASGAKTDRRELRRCVAALKATDVLVVTRLDRLARSTRDLLNVLAEVGERGAAFKSLTDTWADTTSPHGRLMLTVLGGLAEFERELIKARTGEGRTRAKTRGVKFGRKSLLSAEQRRYVAKLRGDGESVRHIARIMGVSPATVGRVPPAS